MTLGTILRLEGLDVKAGTEDIRTFFQSLHIPDGGVYIMGGHLGEAFISFTTVSDAQAALLRSGNFLKGSMVTLHISSMEEIEQKFEESLNSKKTSLTLSTTNMPASNAQLLDTDAFFLGVCSVLHRLQSTQTVPKFEFPHVDSATSSEAVRNPEHTLDLRPGYVRLFGLPASITKEDICKFFKGLRVEDVIVDVELGISRGCLVKFADMQDASDALGFNQQMLGSIPVEVRGAEEKLWVRALQECSKVFDDRSKCKHERSPTEKAHYERRSVVSHKRTSDQVPFKPLKHPKLDAEPNASLSRPSEYTVMVRNLPKNMTKTDIKELFRCQNLPHKNVLHLLDETNNITDTAFLSFNSTEDFDYAINLSGCHGGSGAIEVTSITKELIESLNETGQRYIFIRNMPATVKKSQIRSLFCKFSLSLDDIMLLHDREGYGSGEAVVKFESEQQVTQAQRLHGEEFLGSNVLLTPINEKQMKNILGKKATQN
uniref:RNA binding motif protein 12Ba n=1 Tax=Xiphophorus couchianus TaxID=32473 RepID=A0A3B5MXF9_9TELE